MNQDKLATLYASKEYPFPEYSHPSYADGFISTSNEDMGLYLIEMIKGAKGEGSILCEESYKILFKRKSPFHIELDEEGEVHAVFWDLLPEGRIEHSGGDPGTLSLLSFDPVRNTGYFMMSNINEGGFGEGLGVDGWTSFEQLFTILGEVQEFEAEH